MAWYSPLVDWSVPGIAFNTISNAAGGKKASDYVGGALDQVSGAEGLKTAAEGAKAAQAQAQALSQLQWDRQMQGLQQARGQTQPYLSLYDKIYGTHNAGNVTPMAGGAGFAGGGISATPYNQSLAPRQTSPGSFLPAGRVAGDAALQAHVGGNPLPGGPGFSGLPNGNAATPYSPNPNAGSPDFQALLRKMLNGGATQ